MLCWKGSLLYQIIGPWKSLGFNDNLKKLQNAKIKKLDQCNDGKTGDFAKFINELPADIRLAMHQCRLICQNTRLQIQPLGNFMYFVAFTFILFDI
jgi:hypothetical protein